VAKRGKKKKKRGGGGKETRERKRRKEDPDKETSEKCNRNRKSETNAGQKKIEPTTTIYIHKDSRVSFKILITFTKPVYINHEL